MNITSRDNEIFNLMENDIFNKVKISELDEDVLEL